MISRNRWTPTFALGAMGIGALLLAFPLLAQQQNPASADTSSQGQSKTGAKSGDNKDPGMQEQKSPTNDRLFFVLPNYLTVENAKKIPPLTTGQKFKLVALGTFDPIEYPYVGVLALIDQAENTDPSFRQGLLAMQSATGPPSPTRPSRTSWWAPSSHHCSTKILATTSRVKGGSFTVLVTLHCGSLSLAATPGKNNSTTPSWQVVHLRQRFPTPTIRRKTGLP